VTGSRSRRGHPVSIVGWIYDPSNFEDGADLYARAIGMNLEGIVSKKADEPYRSGRSQITVEGLDHLILKPSSMSGLTHAVVSHSRPATTRSRLRRSHALDFILAEQLPAGGPQGKSEDQPHAKQSAPADCTDMAM
jgi:hypothetical protein